MTAFRFGYQTRTDAPVILRQQVQAAEAAGFDVFCTFDHLGRHLSVLEALAFAAAWSERIRLCPLVLNNDLHHPGILAQRLATLDRLSAGRLEVGIGAGHAFPEYHATSISFDPPQQRKRRLAESVDILRRLLDGEQVDHHGEYYDLSGFSSIEPLQNHVPILVGVNGRAGLAHAARTADIIGLTMLGVTLPDGNAHAVRWDPERLDATVTWIAEQAGERAGHLELNALVQAVVVTDDRRKAAEELAAEVPGLEVDHALSTPFLALGTHDEIAAHLFACRERWGISYYVVRDIEGFAPVIELLHAEDQSS
ncbi:TIGR03621 family F420-dependent LLM class oxidoreductase [Ferrimicrobium acidiphilum]|uniref:TIGR03621 family F420-dependent LLM class oxidoreductase n=1 Tax=Ferrimicrobium acidiphilum TaxID=121039 RepID=UPI0023F0C274|nr:TIGR03621 family F420-dependent LLM class oxidoreductase [Ferrimicrobium acidiphilum]